MEFASPLVVTVSPDDDLQAAARLLRDRRLSSLLVVGVDGKAAGVLSRRDLLVVGRFTTRGHRARTVLELPRRPVGELMNAPVVSVPPTATVADAALLMVSQRIHRVFVLDDGRPVGVFSTRDAMAAVSASQATAPIADVMTSPVISLDHRATLAQALAVLDDRRVSSVVVLDGGLPVGVFGEAEALTAAPNGRDREIDPWVDPSLLLLPGRTPIFRAAAFTAATSARRIVVVGASGLDPRGIVSGLDFCRALLEPAPIAGVAASS